MISFNELQEIISGLSRAEKAQILQWVARDLGEAFPGIESTPGVAGGEVCIVRTRIPVWVLVQSRRLGMYCQDTDSGLGARSVTSSRYE